LVDKEQACPWPCRGWGHSFGKKKGRREVNIDESKEDSLKTEGKAIKESKGKGLTRRVGWKGEKCHARRETGPSNLSGIREGLHGGWIVNCKH